MDLIIVSEVDQGDEDRKRGGYSVRYSEDG